MFTGASKYFLGLTAAAVAGFVLYLLFVTPNDLGAIALGAVMVVAGTLAGITLFNRDAEAETVQDATGAAAQPLPNSVWPIVCALGVALMAVGLASVAMVFLIGLGVLVIGSLEWLIQDWAEGASADNKFNTFIRERAISPLELPLFAAVGGGIIAFSFSRIMLAMGKSAGAILFIIIASAVLLVGFLVAFKPNFRGKIVTVLSTVAGVALIAGGVGSALSGERAELAEASREGHYMHKECGEEKSKYFDKVANNRVPLRSAVAATIILENGQLRAEIIGFTEPQKSVTIPKSNDADILFRNKDEADRRLVLNLGTETVGDTGVEEKLYTCTQLTGKNQENVLVVKIDKQSSVGGPYTFTVPGVDDAIEVVVP
jgi:hypothetical protein